MATELRSALGEAMPRLRRFGLMLTGNALDSDDLVQDACARALDRSEQLRDVNRLDGWLYSIMRHLWIDRLRAGHLRKHETLAAAEHVVGDDGRANVERRLTLAQVRQALERLTADHRTVLMLICVDGMTYKEAADIMGIAVGTVMSRLARARQELQKELDPQTDDTATGSYPSPRNHLRAV